MPENNMAGENEIVFTSDIPQGSVDEVKEEIKIAEYEDFVKHRNIWSFSLLGILFALVLTNLLLVIFVGLGILILDKDFLSVVYVSFVFEIIGLVAIVIKFLFNTPPTLSE